jgi:outer membrane immunogenic protein
LKQSAFAITLLAATILTVAPARAQELKPFQGLYFGVHGGYAWQNINGMYDSADTRTSLSPLDNDQALAGAQLGYNVQYNWFVIGVEADASAPVGSAATLVDDPAGPITVNLSSDMSYLTSIRGRLGVAINDVLLYGTAGVAFSRLSFDVNAPSTGFSGKLRTTDTAGVFGGGIEWKLAYGVSVRGEYLFYDFGPTIDIPTSFPNADGADVVNFHGINVARAALNISLGQ